MHVMDRNKKKVVLRVTALLSVLLMGSVLPTAPLTVGAASIQDQINQLQKEQEKLAQEKKEIEADIKDTKSDLEAQQSIVNNTKAQINTIQSMIDAYTQAISDLDKQIEEKNAQLSQLDQEVAEKEAAIDDQMEKLKSRIQAIAQTGNLSVLQMLMDTEDYAQYLLKSQVMKQISENNQALLGELESEKLLINAKKEQAQAERSAVEVAKAEQESLKKDLDAQKANVDALYKTQKKEQEDLDKQLGDYEKKQEELQKLEDQADAEIQKLLEQLNQDEPDDGSNKYGGSMYWPAPTVLRISSPFGPRWGSTHGGIDISNGRADNEPIVAAADGTVISVVNNHYSYGNYCMVDHGYDEKGRRIVTLYAQMRKGSPLVKVGQQVVGGQTVLGRIGSTGNSTGPHLHFEVRVNGTRVDPVGNGYVALP